MGDEIDKEYYISFGELSKEWSLSELFIDKVFLDLDLTLVMRNGVKYIRRGDIELLRGFFVKRYGLWID
jgi:hypothetical protein